MFRTYYCIVNDSHVDFIFFVCNDCLKSVTHRVDCSLLWTVVSVGLHTGLRKSISDQSDMCLGIFIHYDVQPLTIEVFVGSGARFLLNDVPNS